MKLNDFIKETLVSIHTGLKNANTELRNNGGGYNMTYGKEGEISFDIAVTVSKENKTEGGGGINVYALRIDGEVENKTLAESVSRIKFKVRPDQTHS